MRVKSILNQVEKHKSFVFARVRWGDPEKRSLQVEVRAPANRRPVCSGCGKPGAGYDTLLGREFEFVPRWGIPVCYLYALRRVQCQRCGVKVERVPWAEEKQTLPRSYMQFLATWAQRLSWLEVARFFHPSWEKVFRCLLLAQYAAWRAAHKGSAPLATTGPARQAPKSIRFHWGPRESQYFSLTALPRTGL